MLRYGLAPKCHMGSPENPEKYPSSLIHFQQKNPFLKLWPIGDLRQISAPCQILEPWHFWPLNMGCTRLRSVGGFLFWGWIGYLKVGRLWILPEVGIGFLSLLEVWKVIVIHEPKERWNQDWCFTPACLLLLCSCALIESPHGRWNPDFGD